jgi:cytochrome d ubiquinol oxidase subunit I
VVIAAAAWHMARKRNIEMMRPALKFGLWGMIVAFAGTFLAGDQLGLVMVSTQPMKMAAAEALFNSACGADASFSIFSIGTPDGTGEIWSIRVPYLLSLLSTHTLDGCVEGINDLNAQYAAQWPDLAAQVDGVFNPVLWITYWSFRWMMGLGFLATFIAIVGLWLTRKNAKREVPRWAWSVAIWTAPIALVASLVGWVFTEMGRQPWIVFSLMLTEDGVSPSVPGWSVLISLVAFTAIYASLAVVEFGLILKTVHKGPDPLPEPGSTDAEPPALEDTPTTVY